MAQKAIGPNFAAELAAAGLGGLALAWGADGSITYGGGLTAAEHAAIAAVYAAHDPAKLPAEQVLAQKLAAGCAILSTATPGLDGTYAIDPTMQQRMQAIVGGINAGKGFPHGAPSYAWPVAAGQVTFVTTAEFIAVAAAIEAYVSDLLIAEAALATGNPANWPAQPVTIA